MPEFTIANFKFGLDTRKDVLTSQPGTLVTCENAHINTGGEIEKRKAFDEFADISILDDQGDTGTFGLEVTDVGLVTFGSAYALQADATTAGQGETWLASSMPSEVTYQQLRHPTLINDSSINYDQTDHLMTAVLHSENFNGKAFVIAKFADGHVFIYFDGTLIQHSANGLVMDQREGLDKLSVDLERQVEAISAWFATANEDSNGNTVNGCTLVRSTYLDFFEAIPSENSTDGVIGKTTTEVQGDAIPGARAWASFTVTDPGGTFDLAAPSNIDGTGVLSITGAAIDGGASTAIAAAAIAEAVNSLSYVHGYLAVVETTKVTVFAPLEWGDFTENLEITLTGSASTTVGTTTSAQISATIVPAEAIWQRNEPRVFSPTYQVINANYFLGAGRCQPVGGQGPYTYEWTEAEEGSAHGMYCIAPVGGQFPNICLFFIDHIPAFNTGANVTGRFKCKVTDFLGATTVTYITLSFTLIV